MNYKLSYFFLRLPIAISLLGHGLVRLPKLTIFHDWMINFMNKSILPNFIIGGWAYILPFIEAGLGFLLLIGYKSKYIIYATLTLMSILILGCSSIENWGAIEAQLIHAFYLFILLQYYERHYKRKKTSAEQNSIL